MVRFESANAINYIANAMPFIPSSTEKLAGWDLASNESDNNAEIKMSIVVRKHSTSDR